MLKFFWLLVVAVAEMVGVLLVVAVGVLVATEFLLAIL